MTTAALTEVLKSLRSQPITSAITVSIITGMTLAVMLTTGRTVGAESRILGTIDSAGSRSIVARAGPEAGLMSDIIERLAAVEGIEWAGAFSTAVDAQNLRLDEGIRVPLRYAYSRDFKPLGISTHFNHPDNMAWVSHEALDKIGAPDAAGGLSLANGPNYGIGGVLHTPDFLRQLEPLIIVPRSASNEPEPVGLIIVIAKTPELVAPVSDILMSVLQAEDPQKVTLETSEALAQLRGLVRGEFGTYSRHLVFALLSLTGALEAVLLFGLVLMRRKDFGRRRALGATRGFIVALLLSQTGILSALGIGIGFASAATILRLSGDPLPHLSFVGAVAILTFFTTQLAAAAPAVIASRREPIVELRVP